MYIDEVAVDFPELKIVFVHTGWTWVTQMVAVAWRHKNVFIELSGVRPKYIATPGTGYEPLLVYGNGLLQDQILWGSNWPQVTPEEGIAGVRGFPLKETVKAVEHGTVASTLDRSRLRIVQTPQAFRIDIITEAYRRARVDVTDDAMLVEQMGHKVKVFMGSYDNIKITTPEDLALAEVLWRKYE